MSKYLAVEARIRAGAPYNTPTIPQFTDDYTIRYQLIEESYYIENGWRVFCENHKKQSECDVLVGFYTPPQEPAELTLELGPLRLRVPVKLEAGEFKFAIHGKHTYPAVRSPFEAHSFTEVVGKVYAVYAFLQKKQVYHELDMGSLYCVADLGISGGMTYTFPGYLNAPLFIWGYKDSVDYIEKREGEARCVII